MPRIIIADDADIGRSILKTLLKKDFDILEARNGLEVIRILQSEGDTIDCLVLDLMMPVMDGHKVLAFMRENDLLVRIPTLVLSAISDPAGIVRCLEDGATDVIEKPYEPRVLRAKIQAAIRRMAAVHAAAEDSAAPSEDGELYEAILDALPEAIFLEDPVTRLVSYANAAFRAFPGMVPDPVGHPHSDLIPPREAAAVTAAVDDLLRRHIQRPVSVNGPDGNHYTVLFNALLDDTGTISHVIGSISRTTLPTQP